MNTARFFFWSISRCLSEASATKKRKLGQRILYRVPLPYEIDTGTLCPIANIANKTFPFSTVVEMIVGATM
jgi:hypothetical protein